MFEHFLIEVKRCTFKKGSLSRQFEKHNRICCKRWKLLVLTLEIEKNYILQLFKTVLHMRITPWCFPRLQPSLSRLEIEWCCHRSAMKEVCQTQAFTATPRSHTCANSQHW